MFKIHPDNMRMEPTPERVYAICRLVAFQSLTRTAIQEQMSLLEPSSNNYSEINSSLNVAMNELDLLQAKDNLVILRAPHDVFASMKNFRRHVSANVFQKKDTTFYKVSKWYIEQNENVFELDSWERRANEAVKAGINQLVENDFLGWRFWASFLGLGYLNGENTRRTVLLPNMKIRLQDVFATTFADAFGFGEPIPARDFLEWLFTVVPEAIVPIGEQLPLALSNGLRTLHDLGSIKLETRMDTYKNALYHIDGEEYNGFSHVIVKEVILE